MEGIVQDIAKETHRGQQTRVLLAVRQINADVRVKRTLQSLCGRKGLVAVSVVVVVVDKEVALFFSATGRAAVGDCLILSGA